MGHLLGAAHLRVVVLDLARGELGEALDLDLVDDRVEDVLARPEPGATSTDTIIPFWYLRDLSPSRIVAVLRCDRSCASTTWE